MRSVLFLLLMITLGGHPVQAETNKCPDTLNFTVRSLNQDKEINLCEAYAGKVVLIVNTASKCAFTSQYEGLEALYETYKDRGLIVLGFPSNDFANQEPGTEAEIQTFCRMTYGVQFPMFAKTTVREGSAHPFFAALAQSAGTYPTWNFHKYLIGRDGELIAEFSPRTQPYDENLVAAIETALGQEIGR